MVTTVVRRVVLGVLTRAVLWRGDSGALDGGGVVGMPLVPAPLGRAPGAGGELALGLQARRAVIGLDVPNAPRVRWVQPSASSGSVGKSPSPGPV